MKISFKCRTFKSLAAAAGLATSLVGCSGGPQKLTGPSFSPDGIASKAMELYDKDGDGAIAGSELDATPALKAALATLDADKDGKVTAGEIAQRVEAWLATRTALTSCTCRVMLDGKPLQGATVTFEPDPCLNGAVQTAVGTTTELGTAGMEIPKENRVPPNAPPGLALGLYLVRVSKQANGVESIPARYNTETTLGQQVAPDDPAVMAQKVIFELNSK